MDDFAMALKKKPLGDVNTSLKLKSLRSVGVVFVLMLKIDVHLLKGKDNSFKNSFCCVKLISFAIRVLAVER